MSIRACIVESRTIWERQIRGSGVKTAIVQRFQQQPWGEFTSSRVNGMPALASVATVQPYLQHGTRRPPLGRISEQTRLPNRMRCIKFAILNILLFHTSSPVLQWATQHSVPHSILRTAKWHSECVILHSIYVRTAV
jgi:hypothetical protein